MSLIPRKPMVQAVQESAAWRRDIASIARDYYDLVFRFCARRVGPDAAADAAQDTFLTAQKALQKFRGESTVQTWLLGIANNECRRIQRKRRLEPVWVELNEEAASASPESLVDRHALQQAMMKLSPEHREAIVLVEMDGLSYEEAAEILGVPAGTVKSRHHYAFLNLRRSLFPGGARA